MWLFFKSVDKDIVAADSSTFKDSNLSLDVKNTDQLYEELSKRNLEISDDIDKQIVDLFEINENRSLDSYIIKHWVSNRSFGELIDMFTNNEIVLPEMQRGYVWDSKKSSRLIESILLGLPIPPLFFMEIENNKYEVIDGYQRLLTITNYVLGYPWAGNNGNQKRVPARLSGDVAKQIKGKAFNELSAEQQRVIKRSTIPLIEFRQIDPANFEAKYLIFERINTGSDNLNPMQIRKAAAFGPFIQSLYNQANNCDELIKLFSTTSVKKDIHVEALLRIYALSEIYYKRFNSEKNGLNNILNEFCELNRYSELPDDYKDKVNIAIKGLSKVFVKEGQNNLFKRVVIDSDGSYLYQGNMNICILEAMIGVCINKNIKIDMNNMSAIKTKYEDIMSHIIQDAVVNNKLNPFSTSTGTIDSINKRFSICERIIG